MERVEGFTPEEEWRTAYRDIADFERTIVESDDKWFGRVKTLRTLVETLSKELDDQPGVAADAGTKGKTKGDTAKRRKDKNKEK